MLHGLIDISGNTPIWHFQFVLMVPSWIFWHEVTFCVLNMHQKTKGTSEVGVGSDSISRAISWCMSNFGLTAQ